MSSHLGKTYTDVITGFKGVAVGYVVYVSGCNQLLLVPPVDKDGKTAEAHWFDEQRCKLDKSVQQITLDNSGGGGADIPAPKR